jgi:hypothetical protein
MMVVLGFFVGFVGACGVLWFGISLVMEALSAAQFKVEIGSVPGLVKRGAKGTAKLLGYSAGIMVAGILLTTICSGTGEPGRETPNRTARYEGSAEQRVYKDYEREAGINRFAVISEVNSAMRSKKWDSARVEVRTGPNLLLPGPVTDKDVRFGTWYTSGLMGTDRAIPIASPCTVRVVRLGRKPRAETSWVHQPVETRPNP